MSLSEKRSRQLVFIQRTRLFSFLGFLLFLGLIIFFVKTLLVSFVVSLVLVYMLGPLVNSLERTNMSRLLATVVVFIGAGVLVVIGLTAALPFLVEQASQMQVELPTYLESLKSHVANYENSFSNITGLRAAFHIGEEFETYVIEWTKSLFIDIPSFLSNLSTTLMLAPFFAFFLIKDGRTFSKSFLSLVPNQIFELVLNMYSQINEQLGQFIRARALEALIVGLIVFGGLYFGDFPFAVLLGVFAAIMNLIPYVGPIVGVVPAIAIALSGDGGSYQLILVLVIYGVAQLIDIFFIIPLVVAKLVNLHPITVVLAIIIGAQLLGVLGMIISIPIASALKVTFTSLYRHLVDFKA